MLMFVFFLLNTRELAPFLPMLCVLKKQYRATLMFIYAQESYTYQILYNLFTINFAGP